MRFLFILFILSSLCAGAQVDTVSSKYKISGTIYSTYTYRGGIDFDDSNRPQVPMPDLTLYLIEWKGENEIPVVVTSITTNKKGEFSAKVPSGKYGFATIAEIDSLDVGQWQPKMTETWSGHTLTTSSWQIITQGPIDLTQGPVSNIVLINHRDAMCMDCQ